jgi:UDP-3-O-[3-hydroxymyristoyl] glucosamine N-acyltransferase
VSASLLVERLVHPRLANSVTDLVYVSTPEALQALEADRAKAAVIDAAIAIPETLLAKGCGFLVVQRPRYALAKLSQRFDKPAFITQGIHPTAEVHPTATLAEDVTLGAYVLIGANSKLGKGCVLHAHVSVGADVTLDEQCLLHAGVRIGDRVSLGKRVIIQPNACIGSDGYSYVTPEASNHEQAKQGSTIAVNEEQRIERINSLGTVVLEDDVEVGACTCIDRGTLAETRIGRGTKIDNLTQIGHNNTVGQNCLIVSQVGLAGSCKIGNRVVLAGQVGVGDHITIGDDAVILAKSGVMNKVEPKAILGGSPAMPRRQILEQLAYMGKMKDLHKDVKELKKQLAALQAQLVP